MNAQAFTESEHIEITWTDNSSDEIGYRIERSSEGLPYVQIGEVAANTTSFTDNTAIPGDAYAYRVASLTVGGHSIFSKTETVLITALEDRNSPTLSVHPNPAADYLYINTEERVNYPIRIINSTGHVVKTISAYASAEAISVQELPAGFYMVVTPKHRIKMFKK